MHSSEGFHGPENRFMGKRLLIMGSTSPTIGNKWDNNGFPVMGGIGGSTNFHLGSHQKAAASLGKKNFKPYTHLLRFNIGKNAFFNLCISVC